MYKMSLTIVPSNASANPIILNQATTLNITYTVQNSGTGGVTYSLTGQDADKFMVTYAVKANDATQLATLVLNNATNISNQILYKFNLVATDVADTSITATRPIGVFVSSSTSSPTSKDLLPISNASALGNDDSKTIPELDTTTKAKYPIVQTNANDIQEMTVSFKNGTGTNLDVQVERISDVNYITLKRTVNADGGNANSETVDVELKYTGSNHGNIDDNADPVGAVADPVYTSSVMTLKVVYTPVQIDFYDADYTAAGSVERESGDSIVAQAGSAVVNYYDGSVANANAQTVTQDASNAIRSFPVFLNQKCTWSFSGGDDGKFSLFTDSNLTTAMVVTGANPLTKAAIGYIKFDPGANTNYAVKNEYTTTLTVTDGGACGANDATGRRTLPLKVVVATDTTSPVINDISFNGVAYAGAVNATTTTFDFDEVSAATDAVAEFKLDTTKHGTNDPIADATYYLVQTGTAAGGDSTSLLVKSVGSTANNDTKSQATFTISSTYDGSANTLGKLGLDASGISFYNSYDDGNGVNANNADDYNIYKLGVFAKDSGDSGSKNSSAVVELTITVRNTAGMKYTGQDGSQSIAAVISNGVVTNTGTTNASIIEFGFVANIPTTAPAAGATNDAATLGITLTEGAGLNQSISLVSNVVVTDIAHPLPAMRCDDTVKKLVFKVDGMTSGKTYTLTMPALTPAPSHQNVAGQATVNGNAVNKVALPAAGGMVDTETVFVFTYDSSSDKVMFHGPDAVTWARGHPYTEVFYAGAETMNAAATSNYGAKHNGESGNKMSYYNAVDPTAPSGTNGYFTWTVTNNAGGQTSRTRLVTITDVAPAVQGQTYAGNLPRGPPDLKQDRTANLTFAGSGSVAAQPDALDYTALKESASPTNKAAKDNNGIDVPLTVLRTTDLSTSNRGTLWAYATPGQPANATFDEIYEVDNEDVYAYNFAVNNTTWTEKYAEWAANTAGATVANPTADASYTSQSGRSTDKRTDWDNTVGYLGDIRGKRTVTMVEAANHVISIDLAGLNIDSTIARTFALQATETFSSSITVFDNHATCNVTMDKADFNQIFYYKPESPGITTTGGDSVWTNLISGPGLRSEEIELLQVETNWPVMKSGNADGTIKGTTVELHGLTASDYKTKNPFESNIPDSSNAIHDIVVENWAYDIFGVINMADIFSSTALMKSDVDSYLTSPGAGVTTTTTFEGSVRSKLASLNSTVDLALRKTGENDPQESQYDANGNLTATGVNDRPAQFLLYALHDKIKDNETARYRLTTSKGGMFNPSNKINNAGHATHEYYPFIWQAGDKITVGTEFKHDPVDAGTLFNGGNSSLPLGNIPFKFVITLE